MQTRAKTSKETESWYYKPEQFSFFKYAKIKYEKTEMFPPNVL